MNRAKHTGLIFILAFTILNGCSNLLEPSDILMAPADKGYFILNINEVSYSRTVLPVTIQNDFQKYDLIFTSVITDTNPDEKTITMERTNSNLGDPVLLEVGEWNLEVTAYMDAAKTMPAALGFLKIDITSESNIDGTMALAAIIDEGTGTFKWNIDYPTDVVSAVMIITPYGTEQEPTVLSFTGQTPDIGKTGSRTMDAGYYHLEFRLDNGNREIEREEYLHIYKNLESSFEYTFTQDHFTVCSVTSGDDSGPGTLRYAIDNAPANSTILIEDNVKTINLENRLEINKNIEIDGNGTTLTRSALWTNETDSTQLLHVTGSTVTIGRLYFKDGRASNYGAGIRNDGGTVTLESCIFSGNSTSSPTAFGGAIYNDGTIYLNGCTFYENTSGFTGGAVYNNNNRILSLTGNLFYGNSAANAPIIRYSGIVNSGGYNASDISIGTGTSQSGWAAANGDKLLSDRPASPLTFRLLSGRGAQNAIPVPPAGYPSQDFYGQSINNGAAAGAVQKTAAGYYLDLSVNSDELGLVNKPSPDNEDGLYTGQVTLTAVPSPNYSLVYWLTNGRDKQTSDPLTLPMNAHTSAEAVFARIVTINDLSDGAGSQSTPTLRYALNNARDWDHIRINPGTSGIIELNSELPHITTILEIEGNGVTITRSNSWTTENETSQLLGISGGTVNISRINFKGGRAVSYGAAIRQDSGSLTLESCIFSDNSTSSGNAVGGAIYNNGTLDIEGCTFYGNTSMGSGGAVYNNGNITLTGNLFYGNNAAAVPVTNGNVTSGGYNAVDIPIGTGSNLSGWNMAAGDKNIVDLPISPVSFRLLSGREAANTLSSIPWNYPAMDFYGSPININAAAGAVQSTANGYYIDLTVNNSDLGNISISTPANTDGLYSGSITLSAVPNAGYSLAYLIVNGKKTRLPIPLSLSINSHIKVQAVFARVITINDFTDTAGNETNPTLRYALNNARDWDLIRFSGNTGTGIIELNSVLPMITKKIEIEGNGTTLTRSQTWITVNDNSQLLYINYGAAEVKISSLYFKDGMANSNGAAIRLDSGSLILESCIFSGNSTSSSTAKGGAIYSNGTLVINGCTFTRNTTAYRGGAIYNDGGTLTLTGNLFWENTVTGQSGTGGPVVYRAAGTVNSGGYNAVDTTFGTGINNCGWTAGTGDKSAGDWPVSLKTFRLLSGSGADNVINIIPAYYPAEDFYGNQINNNAAAGAVQAKASGSGYYLDLSINDATNGNLIVTPNPNQDGLVSGSFTITAQSSTGYGLIYWIINGNREDDGNPLTMTLNSHSKIQAVLGRIVNNFDDAQGIVPGTLRYALTYAKDGDIIWMSDTIPGQTTIALTSALPSISRSITIEGNGTVLTRDPSWTTISASTQLLQINFSSAVVNISRMHFLNNKTTVYGGAIDNRGITTFQSCIFSFNNATSDGGAIYNAGTLTVSGCTFYNNSTTYQGGAIYNSNGTTSLTGNIFYGNTAETGPIVFIYAGSVSSGGYNAVNVPYGTVDTSNNSQRAGWNAATGDKLLTGSGSLNITGIPFNTATFVPVSGLRSVMPSSILTGFPLFDFYGNARTWPGAPGAVNYN